MSVWTTKSSGRDRNYIVMKHTLKGANYILGGIRFRDGYAVVEKGSKTHHMLKQIPVLRHAQEYPLTFLRHLPFITRSLDVKQVYGADVYYNYLRELEVVVTKEKEVAKVEEEIKHVTEKKLCSCRTIGEELCKIEALEESPSSYCMRHILEDPRLLEFGIDVPKFLTKAEKKTMRNKVVTSLKALKKEGKF